MSSDRVVRSLIRVFPSSLACKVFAHLPRLEQRLIWDWVARDAAKQGRDLR